MFSCSVLRIFLISVKIIDIHETKEVCFNQYVGPLVTEDRKVYQLMDPKHVSTNQTS